MIALLALPFAEANPPCGTSRADGADVRLRAGRAGDDAGLAVAGGDDLDGDGLPEVVVGGPGFRPNQSDAPRGVAWAVQSNAPGAHALYDQPFYTSIDNRSRLGHAVSLPGDVDGDDYGDVWISGPQTKQQGDELAGAVWLVSGLRLAVEPATVVELAGFSANQHFGASLASSPSAGVFVGAPGDAIGGDGAGALFVFRPPFASGVIDGSLADAVWIGEDGGDALGAAASLVGDLDLDGVEELAIGAPYADLAGAVYLAPSDEVGFHPAASAPVRLFGAPGSQFGASISRGGDLTGDGLPDLVVGAPASRRDTETVGAAYVFPGPIVSDSVDGAAISVWGGTDGDLFGAQVAGLGDYNGDGFDDLAVSAPGYASGQGAVALFFGPLAGAIDLDQADRLLVGYAPGSALGASLAATGDHNGDGLDDLVAGSPFDDSSGEAAGAAYIWWGVACERPVDADRDGVDTLLDCDDANALVFPGAPEDPCNRVDDDCSGAIDDAPPPDWWLDSDADGFGAGDVISTCAPPDGAVGVGGDCDDLRADVHPDVEERCDDPADEDCDGEFDEGCVDTDTDTDPPDTDDPVDSGVTDTDTSEDTGAIGEDGCACAGRGTGGSWGAVLLVSAWRRRRARPART